MGKAYFFNSINGDRKYTADDIVSYFADFISPGVFRDEELTSLKVEAYSGMKITVNIGKASIKGYKYDNPEKSELTLENSDSINDRVDLVVVRYVKSERDIYPVIKKGVPGAIPVKPEVIKNEDIYEIPLASIRVTRGTVSISNGNIIDERIYAYSYMDVNHIHKDGHGTGSNTDMLDGSHAEDFFKKEELEVVTGSNQWSFNFFGLVTFKCGYDNGGVNSSGKGVSYTKPYKNECYVVLPVLIPYQENVPTNISVMIKGNWTSRTGFTARTSSSSNHAFMWFSIGK